MAKQTKKKGNAARIQAIADLFHAQLKTQSPMVTDNKGLVINWRDYKLVVTLAHSGAHGTIVCGDLLVKDFPITADHLLPMHMVDTLETDTRIRAMEKDLLL